MRGATSGGLPALSGGGQNVTRLVTTEVGGDGGGGGQLALPSPEIDQKIDIAKIEGQVKASSVKRVAEFVDKHPDESVSILRTWLHESA